MTRGRRRSRDQLESEPDKRPILSWESGSLHAYMLSIGQ